jgi:hypothetical protein
MGMRNNLIRLIVSISLSLLLVPVKTIYAAEFSLTNNPDKTCLAVIQINGEISTGDDKKFRDLFSSVVRAKPNNCPSIQLVVHPRSGGGDVEAALTLGYEIRKRRGFVVITEGARCESSCVFLLAAGVERIVVGEVGIHRPYFGNLDSRTSTKDIQRQRDELNLNIAKFLKEMDVSQQLLEDMLSIRPEDIKYLTNDELKRYRLVGADATHDEAKTARAASIYGLTSSEYRRRDADADRRCILSGPSNKELEQWLICRNSVLLNIPFAETEIRYRRAMQACSQFSGDTRSKCFGEKMRKIK